MRLSIGVLLSAMWLACMGAEQATPAADEDPFGLEEPLEEASRVRESIDTLANAPDPIQRRDAALALGERAHTAEIVAALCLSLVNDNAEVVRCAAVEALLSNEEAVAAPLPCLLTALQDTSPRIRIRALLAVHWKLKRETEDGVRVGQGHPSFVRLAENKDPVVRGLLALASEKKADDLEAVVPVLLEALRQEDAAPLRQPMEPGPDSAGWMWRMESGTDLEEEVMGILAFIGPSAKSAAPVLLERLNTMKQPGKGDYRSDRESHRVQCVLQALIEMGPAVAPDLAAGLRSEYPVVRSVSAMALADLGKELDKAIPVLIKSLHGPCGGLCVYTHTCRFDVAALGLCGRKAVPALLEAAADEALRPLAVEALGMMTDDADTVVPLLIEALKDPSPAVRATVAYALGSIGSRAVFLGKNADWTIAALVPATEDDAHEVSRNATAALTRIYLAGVKGDADLRPFANLDELEYLNLSGKDVTDAGMVHLSNLKNLRYLKLPETITDQGLAHLAGLVNLESLELADTRVTDAGLQYLGGMTKLKSLGLRNVPGITDAGLVHLKGFTNLEALGLGFTQVTDAGLAHLAGLTNLQNLVLTRHITDAGLVHLEGLEKLQYLNLCHSRVTQEGLRRIEAALPGCDVSHPINDPFASGDR